MFVHVALGLLQIQTSKAAQQEADQLKTQLSDISANLKSTAEQLDQERAAGSSPLCAFLVFLLIFWVTGEMSIL